MSSSIKNTSTRLLIMGQLAFATILSLPYRAVAATPPACNPNDGVSGGVNCAPASPKTIPESITIVVNTMLFIIGIVSVIMIIIGGFRYVFSGGNSQNTTAAKDTILYAVIGLVVAILAYALVNFVLGQFT